jgi:hypothetical protein
MIRNKKIITKIFDRIQYPMLRGKILITLRNKRRFSYCNKVCLEKKRNFDMFKPGLHLVKMISNFPFDFSFHPWVIYLFIHFNLFLLSHYCCNGGAS